MAASPRVELLWWRGCPSWQDAIELVREEMALAGVDPQELVVTEVLDEADAERHGFQGSPTVMVAGRDIEPRAPQGSGLTCRVYRTREGRPSPLPERGDVRVALAAGLEKRTE